ncbi:MAG: hypothetical protein WBB07_16120 [Mycobacterium sp.]
MPLTAAASAPGPAVRRKQPPVTGTVADEANAAGDSDDAGDPDVAGDAGNADDTEEGQVRASKSDRRATARSGAGASGRSHGTATDDPADNSGGAANSNSGGNSGGTGDAGATKSSKSNKSKQSGDSGE